MASWKTQRRKARQRDGNQCQICGDTPDSLYTQLHVHHIIPRADGGTDELNNLVTLCDLCHAACHWHMGPAWCGLSKLPHEQQEVVRVILAWAQQEFNEFLMLPLPKRHAIQKEIWTSWGVVCRTGSMM